MAGELIERHMAAPFVWGVSDCCLAVADVLVGLGHADPAADFRGRYADEVGARAVMGGTVAEFAARMAARLGWQEIAPRDARDGDVGLVHLTIAIRAGGWWHAKSLQGWAMLRRAERAWRPA